jgi:hypothetical protein
LRLFVVSQGVYFTHYLDVKHKINNTEWRKKIPKDAISYSWASLIKEYAYQITFFIKSRDVYNPSNNGITYTVN